MHHRLLLLSETLARSISHCRPLIGTLVDCRLSRRDRVIAVAFDAMRMRKISGEPRLVLCKPRSSKKRAGTSVEMSAEASSAGNGTEVAEASAAGNLRKKRVNMEALGRQVLSAF